MASVLARVPKRPFPFDPLIAEAKRRMRQRRLFVGTLVVALGGGGIGAGLALRGPAGPHEAPGGARVGRQQARPASPSSGSASRSVELFSQSRRSAEVDGRPLDKTLALFRSSRLAATLPAPSAPMLALASGASQMRGEPGALLPVETRRVVTAVGPIYLAPTTRGWLCMQAQRFETCHRGLLRQGISWNFQSVAGGIDVVGIAADNVTSVVLEYGKTRRRASIVHNVFFVYRPISLTSARHLPAIGSLTISYKGGKPSASVPLG